jgi:hypothetical protein
MRKVIPAKTEYADFGSQIALHVLLNEASSKELCLVLILLKDRLVDGLDLIFEAFSLRLVMGEETRSYCQNLQPEHQDAEILIAPKAVQLRIRYLLKYHRDGFAEVDHVDIDFDYQDQREFTITFKAELSG